MNSIIDHQRQCLVAVAEQNAAAATIHPRALQQLLTGEDERKVNKPVIVERRAQ